MHEIVSKITDGCPKSTVEKSHVILVPEEPIETEFNSISNLFILKYSPPS